MNSDLKNGTNLVVLGKFFIAFVIIYFLLTSGKLDFTIIKKSLTQESIYILLAVIGFCFMDMLTALRWRILFNSKSDKKLSLYDSIKLTWTGLFFNPLLPGAVSGDFIKIFYTIKSQKGVKKSTAISSVFIDRFIGLFGIFILYLIYIIANFEIINNEKMRILFLFNLLLIAGVLGFLVLIMLPRRYQKIINTLFDKIPILGKILNKIIIEFWVYGQSKSAIFKALGISIICQIFNTTTFYLLAKPFLSKGIEFLDVMMVLPTGLVASAIPITPLGIGVGHALFDYLFNLIGQAGGANLFTLYLMCVTITFAFGAIPFVFGFKHIKFVGLKKIKEDIEN